MSARRSVQKKAEVLGLSAAGDKAINGPVGSALKAWGGGGEQLQLHINCVFSPTLHTHTHTLVTYRRARSLCPTLQVSKTRPIEAARLKAGAIVGEHIEF